MEVFPDLIMSTLQPLHKPDGATLFAGLIAPTQVYFQQLTWWRVNVIIYSEAKTMATPLLRNTAHKNTTASPESINSSKLSYPSF